VARRRCEIDERRVSLSNAQVAQLSGGTAYRATTLQQLADVYATLQQQIGFDTIKGDASTGWLRLAALAVSLAALAALLINRRLPA